MARFNTAMACFLTARMLSRRKPDLGQSAKGASPTGRLRRCAGVPVSAANIGARNPK
jgi:hypothetical protein